MFASQRSYDIGIGFLVVHLISIGYLALHKKLEFTYHQKTTRLLIIIPQLLLLMSSLTMNLKRRERSYFSFLMMDDNIEEGYNLVFENDSVMFASVAIIISFVFSCITTGIILIGDWCYSCQTDLGEGVKIKTKEARKGNPRTLLISIYLLLLSQ